VGVAVTAHRMSMDAVACPLVMTRGDMSRCKDG
jgi:hypothetical protein